MRESRPLSKVGFYPKGKIRSADIALEDFVTVDNLNANKRGISLSEVNPSGLLTEFKAGDTLIGNIRPYLKKIWLADRDGGCTQDVLTIRPKAGTDPHFLYYSLFRNDFFSHMMNGSKGTKMPRGDRTHVLTFKIPEFDSSGERSIAAVLSCLDSKIEVNNRINAELEAMAKTLYDYWFVQLDFPDQNGKPYKSSGGKMNYSPELKRQIPHDWKAANLTSLATIVGGSTPPKQIPEYFIENGTAWITPKDLSLNGNNKFISKGETDVSKQGINATSLQIMPRGTVLMSSRAPVGYLAISTGKVTTNQGFKSFVPKDGFSTPFIFYTVKNLIPAIKNNSGGSTFKEVSTESLKTIPAPLPSKALIEKYTNIVQSTFARQEALECENQQLSDLRDWLLPMLMNGQVTVTT